MYVLGIYSRKKEKFESIENENDRKSLIENLEKVTRTNGNIVFYVIISTKLGNKIYNLEYHYEIQRNYTFERI